jgi:hypothetical protein
MQWAGDREILVDGNGEPCAVRNKQPGQWPDIPKGLAEWFVDTVPERAVEILGMEYPTVH